MSLRIFEFLCPCGVRREALVDPSVREIQCPGCDLPATRVISAPRVALEGVTGAFPTAADAWVARREEKMRVERKLMREHGEYATGKPLDVPLAAWHRSKRRTGSAGRPSDQHQTGPLT